MHANADTLARLHERIFRPSHDPTRPILTYIIDITAAIDALFLAGHTLDARAIVDSVIAHLHPSWTKVRNKLERRGGKGDDLLEVMIALMKYQETEELRGMLKDDQDRVPALISDGEQAALAQKPPDSSCDLPAEPRSPTFWPKQNSQLVLGLDSATSDAEKSFDHPIPDYFKFAREAESSSFTTSPVRSTFSDNDSTGSRRFNGSNQSLELVDVNSFAPRMGVPGQSGVPDYTQFAREMDQALDTAVLGGRRVAFIVDRRLHVN